MDKTHENQNYQAKGNSLYGREMNSGHPLQNYYSRIYRTYDLVNALFTLGLDKKWRRFTAKECLSANPERILDLCCGTGDLAITLMKNAGDKVSVTGYDLNAEMLVIAKRKALHEKVDITFIQGDAGSMPFQNDEFDSITIGFGFRNLTWENPNRDRHVSEISRILKPGGKLFVLESARPESKIVGFFYTLYLKLILIPLGGFLSGDWNAYRYLAGSSSGFYSFPQLLKLLDTQLMDLHLRKKFLFGSVNLLIAIKRRM